MGRKRAHFLRDWGELVPGLQFGFLPLPLASQHLGVTDLDPEAAEMRFKADYSRCSDLGHRQLL